MRVYIILYRAISGRRPPAHSIDQGSLMAETISCRRPAATHTIAAVKNKVDVMTKMEGE